MRCEECELRKYDLLSCNAKRLKKAWNDLLRESPFKRIAVKTECEEYLKEGDNEHTRIR